MQYDREGDLIIKKVRAHQEENEANDDSVNFKIRGNNEADSAANFALSLHPPFPQDDERELAMQLRHASLVYKNASAVLRLWLALPCGLSKPAVAPRQRRQRQRKPRSGHDWKPAENGMMRCSSCWRAATASRKEFARDAFKKCTGAPRVAEQLKAVGEKGHFIITADCPGETFIVCMRCAAWGTHRGIALMQACRGKPTVAGSKVLKRLAEWKHPRKKLQAAHGGRFALCAREPVA